MNDDQIIQKIASLPFKDFSGRLFLNELKTMGNNFSGLSNDLITGFNKLDIRFNEDELKKIIKKSKNSNEITKNLIPFLNDFTVFTQDFFNRIKTYLEIIENNEATLSGFKYRFILDGITIFTETKKHRLLLIDNDSADLTEIDKLMNSFSKEIEKFTNDDMLIRRTLDETKIREDIAKRASQNAFTSFFFRKKDSFVRYVKIFRTKLSLFGDETRAEKKLFTQFDLTRSSLIDDILKNELKLNFLKKLKEYFTHLNLIEKEVYELERDLLFVFQQVNEHFLTLNTKLLTFLNYISNEEGIDANFKIKVREYIQSSTNIELGVSKSNAIENNLDKKLMELSIFLKKTHVEFVTKINEDILYNKTHADVIAKEKFGA